MKAKLIKTVDGYELFTQGFLKGSTNHGPIESLNIEEGPIRYKLSPKNCQAIELDYDLDEIAEQEFPYDFDCPLFETLGITEKSHKSILIGMLQGTLQKGFQKAIELMGDKKFSEDFLKRMCSISFNFYKRNDLSDCELEKEWENWLKSSIQPLQQTEWDVEIEMKNVIDETKIVGAIKGVKGSGNKITTYKQIPKLNADRCLILKRT